MSIVMILSLIVFVSSIAAAMEEEVIIEPTSPRLWIQALIEQKKDEKFFFTQNERYNNLLADYLKLIAQQKPKEQLQLYSSMIQEAFKYGDEDSQLITMLCERFGGVFSEHFYKASNEQEANELVEKLKKLLKSKNNYKHALKFLRFSSVFALAPLQEDSQQVRKMSFNGSSDCIPLRNKLRHFSNPGIVEQGCLIFEIGHPIRALEFFEDVLVIASANGPIAAYDRVTGKKFIETNESIKNKKPLLITDSDIQSSNEALYVKRLKKGNNSIIYVAKNSRVRYAMPTKNRLVIGNANGEIIGEEFSTKTMKAYEGHTQAITALYAVNRSRFLSGSQDGTIKFWNVKEKECKKTIKLERPVNDFTRFDGNFLCLSDARRINLIALGKQKSTCLYSSNEEIRKIFGFHDLLVAGLNNGNVRLWHGKAGYNKTVLLNLKMQSEIFYQFVAKEWDLYCCYKKGIIIKFPYSFLLNAFMQVREHICNSWYNDTIVIDLKIA